MPWPQSILYGVFFSVKIGTEHYKVLIIAESIPLHEFIFSVKVKLSDYLIFTL